MPSRDDRPFDLIVAGHLCLDLHPDLRGVAAEAIAVPGTLAETGPLAAVPGGVVANTGLALARLGVNVGLMGIVGDDLVGSATIAALAGLAPATPSDEAPLTRHIKVRPGIGSSYSVVLAPAGRDRSFLHHPGPNAVFGAEDVDIAAVRGATLFHLGYPPLMARLSAGHGSELAELFAAVKATGVATSMDMVVPDPDGPSGQVDWPRLLARVLPHVDVFLPSLDEALFMLRRADFAAGSREGWQGLDRGYLSALADELLDKGAVIAGFKLGEQGLYLKTAGVAAFARLARLGIDVGEWADQELWQPAYGVPVVGTTGAGDAAYAGFLAALHRRLAPRPCLHWASAVGASSVEQIDAVSGVRTWDETAARMARGWQVLRGSLPGLSDAAGLH